MSTQEVWYAGVPGAGGDDAIFVLGKPGLKQIIKERFTNAKPSLAVLDIDICKNNDDVAVNPYGSLTVTYE